MHADIRQLIEALHAGPVAYVMALTGGGVGAAAQLLSVPGGSRNLLEVVVPYHQRALAEFLGREPEQYCSQETAIALAQRAYERARWLKPDGPVAGVACTASLATDRPKRGDHRCHVAIVTHRASAAKALTLAKGARDREAEEHLVAAFLLDQMAEHLFGAPRLRLDLVPEDRIDPLWKILHATFTALHPRCIAPDGQSQVEVVPPRVLVPGSFNPLHRGHLGLAEAGSRVTNQAVAFELSVENVDKPPLSGEEVDRRVRQFQWKAPLWLTRTPTFSQKAALFPGTVFVVGADTAARIILPRYYHDSDAEMFAALETIQRNECRFLVAGRVDATGLYIECTHLSVPEAFRGLFVSIPESEFRHDISSTQLRGLAVS